MEQLKQILRDNQIQITQQRLEVLQVLRELNTHVTVDDVVSALRQKEITLTLASVYNILGLFEKKGLIMKIGAAGEPVIFDVNTFPHFHICDPETRQVKDYIDDDLLQMIRGYLQAHPISGMTVDRIDLNLIGHIQKQ
jgi:Fe2+ or Zn2+ uptake regulation protein